MAPATGTGEGDLPYPAWSMDWMTPEVQTELMSADCVDPAAQQERATETAPDEPMVACAPDGSAKYLLGPEVIAGSSIENSSVASDVTPTGQPAASR